MTTNIRVNFGGMNKWERCKTDTQFMWRKPLHSDGESNHLTNGSTPNLPKPPRGGLRFAIALTRLRGFAIRLKGVLNYV